MTSPVNVQQVLQAFVGVAAERDEAIILERAVDVCRVTTGARFGAAVLVDEAGITHISHAGMTTSQVAALPHLPEGRGVLGAVLADGGQVIRLTQLQDHPASVGFPLGHVPMAGFLGVPIQVDGHLLGAVYLSRGPGEGHFTDDDEFIVTSLAGQTGHAVISARALRSASALAARLEQTERLKSRVLSGMSREVDPIAALQQILAAARNSLRMELSFLTREIDGVLHMTHVSGHGESFGCRAGKTFPLEEVYCHHIREGRIPQLVGDTAAHPVTASLPITAQARIGSYVHAPLDMGDEHWVGSLCVASHVPRPDLGDGDRELLLLLSVLAAEQLQRLDEQEAARRLEIDAMTAYMSPHAITMVVQPIVSLLDGSLTGVEALARFPGRSGGPVEVFADAERLGVGVDLQLAAVSEALALVPQVPAPAYLSLNASPSVVVDRRLPALLRKTAADRVVVEITEHLAVDDYDLLAAGLAELRRLGVRIAVDDAGSGFASLRHVLGVAPDIVKLDRALSHGIDVDPARRSLASALVAFTAEIGAGIVAEGIESCAELGALRDLGVPTGQGFYLGRPAPLTVAGLTAGGVSGDVPVPREGG